MTRPSDPPVTRTFEIGSICSCPTREVCPCNNAIDSLFPSHEPSFRKRGNADGPSNSTPNSYGRIQTSCDDA